MEEELFLNGFCKTQNQGRCVIAEYEREGGIVKNLEVNCGYGNCKFQDACQIAAQLDELQGKKK